MKTLTGLLLVLLLGCSKPAPPPAATYWCPMHPEVTSTNPNAQCDKCGGMKLLPKEEAPAPAKPAPVTGKYTCPMHPQIQTDKPGECPICHMALVPVTATHSDGGVRVSPEARQAIGLKLGAVETRELRREIRAAARIVPAENRLHRVTARVDGWIEKLPVTTGQVVKEGDALLSVYSPELLAAQRELAAAQAPDLAAAARRRLDLLGFDGNTLRAPAAGHVLERPVLPGQKIMSNDPLVVIADLTTVWAEIELFAADFAAVAVGAPAELTVAGQTVTGKVVFVSPVLDPMTRTAKARVELANADLKLKPEMWATAKIAVELGSSLAVPAAAVMRTGENAYVFKDAGDGKLEPVMVKLGARAGDWFVVLEGVAAGDQVVTAANFLIDSEAQVKGALAGMGHQH